MSNLNFSGRIARYFLHNRPLTILILVATIAAGLGAYVLTPKQYNPTITLPAFTIELTYPGATAQEVEDLVTHEMEEKIADIEGVDTISSRSMDGGKAFLAVQFHIGEDPESSKIKIAQKIQENLDRLAFSMEEPIIKNMDPESVPILTIGFTSPVLTQNEIRTQATEILSELRKVPDIANLNVHGGEGRALKILLDPQALELRSISPLQVAQIIQSSNERMNVGNLKDGESVHALEVSGVFADIETIKNLPITDGVLLQDIAQVFQGYREKTSFVQVSHKGEKTPENAVFLSLAKRKGSNAITVVENVQTKLDEILAQDAYKHLHVELYRNEGLVAQKSIGVLLQNLITSVLIVSGILILFLGFRSALVVAIAIPLTIGSVFLVGYLWGESINRITLFALILSLGMLVDNATVVVENIFRHTQKGKPKKEAIVEAVNEVGMGLFASTVTSVIVFLPTSQISGMMGEYMGPLSFFVPVALILSLIIAYVLTPFLADVLITPSTIKDEKKTGLFAKIETWYGHSLKNLLEVRWKKRVFLGIIFGLFIGVLSFPVLQWVHFRMLPTADKEQFFVYIDTPEGTDIGATKSVSDRVVTSLLTHPEVVSVQQFIGESSVVDFNGFFKGSHMRVAPHMATLQINLTAPEDREVQSSFIVSSLRNVVWEDLRLLDDPKIQLTTLKFLEDPPGPPVRSTLEIKIQGPDRAILEQVAQDLNKKVAQKKGIVDIDTSIEHPAVRTILAVDHQKALATGISAAHIQQTLALVLNPWAVDQYHIPNAKELAHVELQFDALHRDELQDLSRVRLMSASGEMISLESLVQKKTSRQSPVLYTDDREPTLYISAEMVDRSVVYPVIELMRDILDYEFPGGGQLESWDLFGFTFQMPTGQKYFIRWGGEFEMTLENFRDLGIAMIAAFLLIYIVLVAQFESFKIPLLIMTTMPLGFIGIMPGFAFLDWGWGTFLTATSLIGFIALMGIVVNNAIMYLEYFQVLESQGMKQHAALIEAGKTRLRPILLTSLTTVLGNLTIVTDPVWSGLAWAIVFGLSLSTILTLGVFPLLYEMTHRGRV